MEQQMKQATFGDTVQIHFQCKLEDGTVFDSSLGREPLQFTIGDRQIMPVLEQSVIGMEVTESKSIKILAEKAFGPYNKELLKVMPLAQLPNDLLPELGREIQDKGANGEIIVFRITDISGEGITLDANHPLAGKDLFFDVQLIKILPTTDEANEHINSGNSFAIRGQLNEAIACYRKALKVNPNSDVAYNNLGNVFKDKGQIDEAIDLYKKALQINQNYGPAYSNLGNALKGKGLLDEAIASYQKALQSDPNHGPTYSNLGNAFTDKGQIDKAISCYQKAIDLSPTFVEAYYNFGALLREQNKMEEAAAVYNKAAEINPNDIIALWGMCLSRLPIIYQNELSVHNFRHHYRDDLLKLHSIVSNLTDNDLKTINLPGLEQPFYLPYQGCNDRELQKLYGEIICKIMASKYPQFASCPEMPSPLSTDNLRIGFVSGFFCQHSNWKIPIRGWIENIDKQRFSLYGYYTGNIRDKITQIARQSFKQFVDEALSFERLCQIIRKDNLHVLIYPEIGMHPITGRLAALKLAPVQCNSWGHPNTSGLPTIDYYLSSDLMEVPDSDSHYTERLIRLPNISVYYTPLEIQGAEVNRNTFHLRSDSILYLCCQSLKKYLPQYDWVFPKIAQNVNNCQFLFISHASDFVTKQFLLRMSRLFKVFDLKMDDYITILPKLDSAKYHTVNGLADIFLDSIGWSGSNTTLEAIACNLPIVTLPGDFMRGRHSMAILKMMKIYDTIAKDIDDYVEISIKLGKDLKWRRNISQKIKANKHLVYRDMTCISALEDFIERAVKNKYSDSQNHR
jgi:protein O-GlcNAc transferase